MDLWNALGISPATGLLAASAGLVTALIVAGTLVRRRARPRRSTLDLERR